MNMRWIRVLKYIGLKRPLGLGFAFQKQRLRDEIRGEVVRMPKLGKGRV